MEGVLKFIACILLVALLPNCSPEMDEREVVEPNPPDEEFIVPDSLISENAFLDISSLPGIHAGIMPLEDRTGWKYKVRIPELEVNQSASLIVGLVWSGSENDHVDYFDCLLEPSFRSSNSYLFVPEETTGSWFSPRKEQLILELVKNAKEYWAVDIDKIVVTGYSIGGTGSWHYAINHDSIFTAAIPMAGIHQFDKHPQIPIYGICGDRDELIDHNQMSRLVSAGTSVLSQFEVEVNKSHFEACNYQNSLSNAARWLEESVFK